MAGCGPARGRTGGLGGLGRERGEPTATVRFATEEPLGGRDAAADHAGDGQRDSGERATDEQRPAARVEGHRAGWARGERALLPAAGAADGAGAAALLAGVGADLLHAVERHGDLAVVAEPGQDPLPSRQPTVQTRKAGVAGEQQDQPASGKRQVRTIEERARVPARRQEEREGEGQPPGGRRAGGQTNQGEQADGQLRHGQQQPRRHRMGEGDRSHQPADRAAVGEAASLRGEPLRPRAEIGR